MSHDWAAELKKHVQYANQDVIGGIVKHLGTALQSRDGSLVACDDEKERHRVRDSFPKEKLGLTAPDAELDKAIMDVCEKMRAERDKPRVTFYYLLEEKYGKLSMFT
jgi:Protein of unknown function (DUF2853)